MNRTVLWAAAVGLVANLASCKGTPGHDLSEASQLAMANPPDHPIRYDWWENGPPSDPSFFPIAVWLQDPELAPRYKALGVNTYIGLWQGPTEEQLAELKKHGMKVICQLNAVGMQHRDDPTIIAWMHGDEPDNRQAGGGPVPLDRILDDYLAMKVADPTRPVFMNLGQGVANEKFGGRALEYTRYPDYLRGCDIASYDVYPIANYKDRGADGRTILRDDGDEKLWLVARGVRRLRRWTEYRKPVWNVVECTHISNPARRAAPHQVRAEVWMSIIHGSQGICWFVHQWEPVKNVAQLLADAEMREAVRRINHEVLALAPVLNAGRGDDPRFEVAVGNTAQDEEMPVALMTRSTKTTLHIFAVNMADKPVEIALTLNLRSASPNDGGVITLKSQGYTGTAAVHGEGRTIPFTTGQAQDSFPPHAVHIYRVDLPPAD